MQFAYRHCNNPAPRNQGRYCTGKRAIYRSCSITPCPANGTLLPRVSNHRRWSVICILGLPWWLSGQESACLSRRHRFNSWVRKIPWRREWLQDSCLGNPLDRGAWWATVHGITRVRHNLATRQQQFYSSSRQ